MSASLDGVCADSNSLRVFAFQQSLQIKELPYAVFFHNLLNFLRDKAKLFQAYGFWRRVKVFHEFHIKNIVCKNNNIIKAKMQKMKFFRSYVYSVISSIVATAIGAVFILGITGVLSGEPGVYTVLKTEELHRISGNDFQFIDGETYNLGYKTYGSYLYSTLGTGISNKGYVLIPEGTNSQYLEAKPETLELIQALELLEEVPARPKMSVGVWLVGNLGTILFLAMLASMAYLLIYVIVKDRAKEKRKNVLLKGTTPEAELSGGDDFRAKLLLATCHAANADNKIEEGEIETIIKIVDQVSSIPVSRDEVHEIISLIPPEFSEVEASKIGKDLDEKQKWMIIHACILMAVSDGHIDNSELHMVFRMGVVFGFSEKDVFEKFKSLGLTKDE
ncbi:TerB family tellurite resistance protein [uncultured Sulfitobacter sp.]|uniref:TerB family tellurite resistance protein n=1 Tax=uncultured Sulfitobacter sp. TaxID=191468 RepID=UPI002605C3A4|nr:TerB family tellurite resistance protein [uncultured Sulfitobacter sp.]